MFAQLILYTFDKQVRLWVIRPPCIWRHMAGGLMNPVCKRQLSVTPKVWSLLITEAEKWHAAIYQRGVPLCYSLLWLTAAERAR